MKLAYRKFAIEVMRPYGKMRCECWKPQKANHPLPAVLWMHGGGFSAGSERFLGRTFIGFAAKQIPMVILSPGYRLLDQGGYPRQLEDVESAYLYLRAHAQELGVDPNRIFVAGESAGGNLAAALAMKSLDENRPFFGQLLCYPMLDYRETEFHKITNTFGWNNKRNQQAWKEYLKDLKGKPSEYASPILRRDLRGLPPTYALVCNHELFYEETMQFVTRLKEAGVKTVLDIYEGRVHAFDFFLPFSKQTKAAKKRFAERLSAMLETSPN